LIFSVGFVLEFIIDELLALFECHDGLFVGFIFPVQPSEVEVGDFEE
jgi:hypothetical protein